MTNRKTLFARLVTVTALVLSANVAAVRGQERPVRRQDTTSVAFSYNERTASDATRAAVARLIIDGTALESWWVDTVPPRETGREFTVLRKYQYWGGQYPLTAGLLVSVIDSVNGLRGEHDWSGKVLRVPPVPVRGHTRGTSDSTRLFDVTKGKYGLLSTQVYDKASVYVYARTDSAPPPLKTDTIRSGGVTTVFLPVSSGFIPQARRIVAGATANELEVQGAAGLVPLELYGAETMNDCSEAGDWIKTSPFRSYVKQRISALSPAEKGAIAARAIETPLTVVDWNFQAGHGAKVRSVVAATLDSLGLFQLLDPKVRIVELEPTKNKASLVAMLEGYKTQLGSEFRDATADQWNHARAWLNVPIGANKVRTHEQILRAVFWKILVDEHPVANFSFGVYAPQFAITPPRFGPKVESFAFFAAGNDSQALDEAIALQNLAARSKTIVTVTSASRTGRVIGTFGAANGPEVTIAGPACGFHHGSIVPNDTGSSFASPFIATVAWVAKLMDPNGEPQLRDRLTMAVAPWPLPSNTIASEGMLDMWLMLAWPSVGASVVLPTGDYAKLDTMDLSLEIGGPNGITTRIRTRGPSTNGGLALQQLGADVHAWWRVGANRAGYRGPLVAAKGNVVIAGKSHAVNSPAELYLILRNLWY